MTETKPSQITSGVRKHRTPQISHVIPFFQLCTNSQKSQNFNDPTSNIKTTGRELRATFLRNHPRPAPNGELRRLNISLHNVLSVSQKAPSAKRCIKTCCQPRVVRTIRIVRKHRAPKGALRLSLGRSMTGTICLVRKHRAPKGALRLAPGVFHERGEFSVRKHRAPTGALRPIIDNCNTPERISSQKAPSAKRCIKTE